MCSLTLHIPVFIFVIGGRVSPIQGNTAIIENGKSQMPLQSLSGTLCMHLNFKC